MRKFCTIFSDDRLFPNPIFPQNEEKHYKILRSDARCDRNASQ
ncbi:MAG: hypothetical protein AAGA60_13165 [Cyanobacteria bacterium P01_E01_bin.42]